MMGHTLRHKEEHNTILDGMMEGKHGRGRLRANYIKLIIKYGRGNFYLGNSKIKYICRNHGEII